MLYFFIFFFGFFVSSVDYHFVVIGLDLMDMNVVIEDLMVTWRYCFVGSYGVLI